MATSNNKGTKQPRRSSGPRKSATETTSADKAKAADKPDSETVTPKTAKAAASKTSSVAKAAPAQDVKATAEKAGEKKAAAPENSADSTKTAMAAEDPAKDSKVTAAKTAATSQSTASQSIDQTDPKKSTDDSTTVAAKSATPAAAAPQDKKSGGFFPMLLGGLVAGGIGFAAGTYVDLKKEDQTGALTEIQQAISASAARGEENASRIAELSTQLDAAPKTDGLEALRSEITTMRDSAATVQTSLAALDERLLEIEKRPTEEGLSQAALDAYDAEMAELTAAIAEQKAQFEATLSQARESEANAEELERRAAARAAFGQIDAALGSGAPFATAAAELEELTGAPLPTPLGDIAETGAVTLAELQATFPAAARDALAVVRRETAESGESGGFGAFLQNQLGARSVEPRDGDDPDAVLSRAEAAVREGRLADAYAEIDTLPETAKSALSDWLKNAQSRSDALAAAETLYFSIAQ